MSQKQLVIGPIENEIEFDPTRRAAVNEASTDFEEVEGQDNDAILDNFDSENEDIDDEPDKSDDQGMSMEM